MDGLKIILLVAFFYFVGGFTPVLSQVKFSKEQIKQLKEANYYYEITDYVSALKIYDNLYKIDSSFPELNYRIGRCMFNLGSNKLQSVKYFKNASEAGYVEGHYYLARCYHLQMKFNDAIKLYQKYKTSNGKKLVNNSEIDRYIDISVQAKEMINNPVDVTIENIGPAINSKYSDYVPLLSADESVLIFTSRRKGSTGSHLDPYNHYFEDIYISYKENGGWTEAKNIGLNINTETHDACVGLSSDGATLIIYRTNKNLTGGDLYWSKLEGETWKKPIKFGSNINTEYQEPSASLTADGNKIYFSSNRPGGYGGKDIYRAVRFVNGEWSLPLNLGPTINTPYNEDAPFIHPDGKTLYYSSKGHKTMGGYDIFKSIFEEDSLWSEPENLGYPINTVDDDIYFVLSADGQRGYYSSSKVGGYNGQDIYIINMPYYEAKLLTVIKGIVSSGDSLEKPLKAKITLINDKSNKIQGIYNSNSATGKYLLIISPNIKYKMLVETENHYSHTEYIEFTNQDGFNEMFKQIKLEPKSIKTDTRPNYIYSYTLEDVYFDKNKYELLPESYNVFTSLVRAMIANTKIKIEIAGYTDNVGDEEYNLELSRKRTNAVRDYFISQGIEGSRLVAKGCGATNFITSNDTEQGGAKNRRVEIRVIKE